MDEENNNEKQENGVIKDTAKSLGKLAFKKIKKWIIIGTLCLAGLLLVVGLLHLVEYEVKNVFSNLINSFKISSAEDAEHVSTETNDSVIYIDKNGKYKLKEDYSEQILQELKEQKVNNKVMGFNLDDEGDEKLFKDMIDTYIKAEVATTFPNTGDSFWEVITRKTNDVEGNITIKRAKPDGNAPEPLTYVKYEEFCSMVEGGDTKALDCFSLNPENFMLCIATKESETEYFNVDANGNPTSVSKIGGNLKIDELDYRKQLENYAVPLNFTITMHLVSLDVDFMKELVELATGANKDDPLELTYIDSQQQYITEYSYTGKTEEIVQSILDSTETTYDENSVKQLLTENAIAGLSVGSVFTSKDINNDNAVLYYNDAVTYEKQVTTTYSGRLYITKADTWLKTSKRTVTKLPNETISSDPITNDIIIDPRNYTYTITNDITSPTPPITKVMTTQETIQLSETEKSSSSSMEYSVVDGDSQIIVDQFINLIKKYPKVENRISTAPSNIFYLLQQNENTQKLEKIMRYVLYELNDVNYGVTEKDLDFLLAEETFISAGGGIYSGGTPEETIWFTMLGNNYTKAQAAAVIGNLNMESGYITNNLENEFEIGHEHSIGHTDESYTEAVNNGLKGITTGNTYTKEQFISDHYLKDCGAGYGMLQWTWFTRKQGLYELAQNTGKNIDDFTLQLEYLLKELSGSSSLRDSSVWQTTEDPGEAAKVLCEIFINPKASTSNKEKRAQLAQSSYDRLKDKTAGSFEEASGGGGTLYTGTYTSTRGRRFTILNQNTIPGWGAKCNRAAAAIIASGYTNQDASTLISTLNTKYAEAGDTIVPRNNFFNLYGLELTAEYGGMGVSQYSDTLRNQLQSGGYAMVWLSNGPYYGASGTKWTGEIHWVAVLDYKNEGGNEQILIADWRGAGWYGIGEFKHGISKLALINEM